MQCDDIFQIVSMRKDLLDIHDLRKNPHASSTANKVISALQPSKIVGEFILCFLVTRAQTLFSNFNNNIIFFSLGNIKCFGFIKLWNSIFLHNPQEKKNRDI